MSRQDMKDALKEVVEDWVQENLMQVQLVVFNSSNYILSDMISDETGESVTPAIFHEVMTEMGFVAEHRHSSCFAYNAKFRVKPKDEDLTELDEYLDLPTRHKPVVMFAQAGPDGAFYICVATNIRGRLAELDQFNPNNIYLRGVLRGAYAEYGALREGLEPWLLKGNWYEPAPEVLRFIYQSGKVDNDLDKI